MHDIAQDGLENLRVDCFLGDDVVGHMGRLTVRVGPAEWLTHGIWCVGVSPVIPVAKKVPLS